MPTPYETAVEYVIDDTQRPDFADPSVGIIQRRIKRAIQRFHLMDFWLKDFVEQIYAFQNTQAIQIINTNLMQRMRAIGYIRKWDASMASQYQTNVTGAPRGSSFEEINPQRMLDGYGYDRRNTMYRSGTDIKLNSSEPINQVLLGYFVTPLIEPVAASDSWILREHPNLIASDASMRIFKDIGKDEESRNKREELAMEILQLQTNNIKLAVLQ